jgi:hypothetical protein
MKKFMTCIALSLYASQALAMINNNEESSTIFGIVLGLTRGDEEVKKDARIELEELCSSKDIAQQNTAMKVLCELIIKHNNEDAKNKAYEFFMDENKPDENLIAQKVLFNLIVNNVEWAKDTLITFLSHDLEHVKKTAIKVIISLCMLTDENTQEILKWAQNQVTKLCMDKNETTSFIAVQVLGNLIIDKNQWAISIVTKFLRSNDKNEHRIGTFIASYIQCCLEEKNG